MRNRLRSEQGFTMATTALGMFVVTLLVLGTVTAVGGDVHLSRGDLDRKQAYEAARAGVNDYSFHLNADNNYWTRCTAVPTPNAVNQQGSTTRRRPVPGSTGATYAIELLPATGHSSCDTTNAVTSMIESSGAMTGSFRIRSTGYSGNSMVSLVATFRRASFLDYMYFTQLETSDPVVYGDAATVNGAYQQCTLTYQQGRYNSPIPNSGGQFCTKIAFISGDAINGPLHTNDALGICGSPSFGRTTADSIEASATAPGWFSICTPSSPTFTGTYVTSAPVLTPPPSNAQLANIAQPAYKFNGQIYITLNGNSMTVTTGTGTVGPISFPSNGIVYVTNNACSASYTPFGTTYPGATGCGNVYVHGSYSGQLTIAAENDVVVDGNLTNSGGGMLGLIANNFVRVYHPCSNGTNGSGSLPNLNVDAAILTINHSFIVDNYNCGAQLGTLTVHGAIAQKFRGPVGTYGSANTGYTKNYVYDDRLRYVEPPNFIDPVQSAWVVGRETRG
jgi:Tfp pilus assembly protein PilX